MQDDKERSSKKLKKWDSSEWEEEGRDNYPEGEPSSRQSKYQNRRRSFNSGSANPRYLTRGRGRTGNRGRGRGGRAPRRFHDDEYERR